MCSLQHTAHFVKQLMKNHNILKFQDAQIGIFQCYYWDVLGGGCTCYNMFKTKRSKCEKKIRVKIINGTPLNRKIHVFLLTFAVSASVCMCVCIRACAPQLPPGPRRAWRFTVGMGFVEEPSQRKAGHWTDAVKKICTNIWSSNNWGATFFGRFVWDRGSGNGFIKQRLLNIQSLVLKLCDYRDLAGIEKSHCSRAHSLLLFTNMTLNFNLSISFGCQLLKLQLVPFLQCTHVWQTTITMKAI